MSKSPTRILLGAAVATSAVIVAGSAASATAPDDGTIDCDAIVESADVPAELTTFVELGSTADLAAGNEEAVTVFMPVNAAFDVIPQNVLDSIIADQALLSSIVNFHMVPGALTAAELEEAGTVPSALGAPLTFATDDAGNLTVNGASVLCSELDLGGSMLYVIDEVLQPPRGADAPSGSTLPGDSIPGASIPGDSVPGSSMPAEFDADQQAVATAWETVVDSAKSFDDVAPLIVDADAIRATIESYPTAAEMVQGITARVTSVTIDGDTAHVLYIVRFNGVDAPYGELETMLTKVDGEWVVPQDEYCALMAYARNNCPA